MVLRSRISKRRQCRGEANLVEKAHPDLAKILTSIECVTVGLVNLEWTGQKLSQDAFGFLVSSSENSPLLDVVFNSCSFPQGERTILTAMMGGRWFESLFGRNVTEETLLDIALKEVKQYWANMRLPGIVFEYKKKRIRI